MEPTKIERIESTRRYLRKHAIKTILNEYDSEILGLSIENQKEKYQKMTSSPFQFYRGSAYLFYYDVLRMPISFHTPADKPTWLQGDLHFENFSAFMNKKGDMVFDTDDFDEGYLGSYLHDVLRMTASIALFAEELNYNENEQKSLIRTFLQTYYEQIKDFAEDNADPGTLMFNDANTAGPVQHALQSLKTKEREEVLEEVTTLDSEQRQFVRSEQLESLNEEERVALENAWPEYIASIDAENEQQKGFFHIKDVVKKHGAGTGSIGLSRYYILIEGKKDGKQRDDIVLEAKEARTPVPAHFLSYDELFTEDKAHHGRRVITTQKAMHYLEDPFLGYLTIGDHHFYVRENSPFDESVDQEELTETKGMNDTVEVMGKITAKIHARADADADEIPLSYESEEEILKAIGDDFNHFLSEVVVWSMFYKNQVNQDYLLFCEWCRDEFDIEI
ncbi:DUF2252 domain-containing protein [Lentibacillus jeotgali]|uniref:DUF2252 domain-containing protein n=1 Tax=Lentibacillus jeotgali TaxID=558169 RepID=UPI0002626C78|nr:DUF2252 family protein [Lentibacillus jeotgali]